MIACATHTHHSIQFSRSSFSYVSLWVFFFLVRISPRVVSRNILFCVCVCGSGHLICFACQLSLLSLCRSFATTEVFSLHFQVPTFQKLKKKKEVTRVSPEAIMEQSYQKQNYPKEENTGCIFFSFSKCSLLPLQFVSLLLHPPQELY